MKMFLFWLKQKILSNVICGVFFAFYICVMSIFSLYIIEVYDNIYSLILGLNLLGYSLYSTYWILRSDDEEIIPLIKSEMKNDYYVSCIDDNTY